MLSILVWPIADITIDIPWGSVLAGLLVTLIGGGVIWFVRWLVNQGPTALNNQRLTALLETNEKTIADLVLKNTEAAKTIDSFTAERTATDRAIKRLTLQADWQQERIELIEAMYTQETGKKLPPAKPLVFA